MSRSMSNGEDAIPGSGAWRPQRSPPPMVIPLRSHAIKVSRSARTDSMARRTIKRHRYAQNRHRVRKGRRGEVMSGIMGQVLEEMSRYSPVVPDPADHRHQIRPCFSEGPRGIWLIFSLHQQRSRRSILRISSARRRLPQRASRSALPCFWVSPGCRLFPWSRARRMVCFAKCSGCQI